jgi:hypothetical protein
LIVNKLKELIGNDKFMETKCMVNVTFHLKEYSNGHVDLFLDMANPLLKLLRLLVILGFLVSFNY